MSNVDPSAMIEIRPSARSGKPCFKGTRIAVYDVLDYLASGMTPAEIVDDFPELTEQHVRAAIQFAAMRERHQATGHWTSTSSAKATHPPDLMTDSRLTALIALCDVADDQPSSPMEDRFHVSELAQLANGDLVVLRDRLGWTTGCIGEYQPPDIDDVLSSVENVVLPDEDAPGCEPHPWEWLVTLAAERGLTVTVEQLKEVPYRIYLSDRVINSAQSGQLCL